MWYGFLDSNNRYGGDQSYVELPESLRHTTDTQSAVDVRKGASCEEWQNAVFGVQQVMYRRRVSQRYNNNDDLFQLLSITRVSAAPSGRQMGVADHVG